MVLLQTSFIAASDNTSIMIFVAILSVLLVGAVISALRGRFRSANRPEGFRNFSLRRACKDHGLDTDHFRILKRAIRDQKIKTPSALFTNGRFLNSSLKKLIEQIDTSRFSEKEKETLKGEIFEIKQRISNAHPAQGQPLSTRGTPLYQEATIFSKAFPPFITEIVGKSTDFIIIKLPKDSHGDWVAYKPGSQLKIRYVRDEGKVYTFVSVLKDIRDSDEGMTMLLSHSNDVKRVQLRKSPRKEMHKPVFFYKVDIITEGQGRKAVKKALVDKARKLNGTMIDISAGGCGLVSRTPVQKGGLIMLTFDLPNTHSVNVFGKVRGIQKDKGGSLMHVAFTKVSQKHLNDIRALVYGFVESEEHSRNQYMIS